ncbi:hypothetical protein VNO77_24713 [Canavalia gladiata]|uniref:Uncharacterized protein n=1 Tax=Canavalia gladiata TaxID=3824 RepID=A0AAN9LC47_CANGL
MTRQRTPLLGVSAQIAIICVIGPVVVLRFKKFSHEGFDIGPYASAIVIMTLGNANCLLRLGNSLVDLDGSQFWFLDGTKNTVARADGDL